MYGNAPDTFEWENPRHADEAGLFEVRDDETGGEPVHDAGWMPSGFVEWFAVGQTLLPALLFLPGSQAYRLPIRTGAYAVSLIAFALWWFDRGGRQRGRHPATSWIVLTMIWLALMLMHPDTGGLAGF